METWYYTVVSIDVLADADKVTIVDDGDIRCCIYAVNQEGDKMENNKRLSDANVITQQYMDSILIESKRPPHPDQ